MYYGSNPWEDGPCFGFDYDADEMDWLDRDDEEYHRRQDEELAHED